MPETKSVIKMIWYNYFPELNCLTQLCSHTSDIHLQRKDNTTVFVSSVRSLRGR